MVKFFVLTIISLTWLIHHRFKEMFVVTVGIIFLAIIIGFPENIIAEHMQLTLELLFAKWLGL